MCRHFIWLLSTLNSVHIPTIYLWLKNENTLETSRSDITTILTWTENQITKCFIPHKLGKISVVLTDHCIFFWVCSFLISVRKIKGRPLDGVFPTDKIISCKCYRCCSVKSWLTLCEPIDCSIPGFPVPHYLPEFAQIHVYWVGDAV